MDSLQLCNRSLPCCILDMDILESEYESSSEARASRSVGHGDIVSNFKIGLRSTTNCFLQCNDRLHHQNHPDARPCNLGQ